MGDLLFNFTEWLRNTPLNELALCHFGIRLRRMWIGEHFWAIPIFQVIHILAISASFASVLMINARMLGIAGSSTLEETTARYLACCGGRWLVLVLSGILMIIGEPIRELINAVFWIKMALVVIAILFTIWFHKGVAKRFARHRRGFGRREAGGRRPRHPVVHDHDWRALDRLQSGLRGL